jgi:hypothetical protein
MLLFLLSTSLEFLLWLESLVSGVLAIVDVTAVAWVPTVFKILSAGGETSSLRILKIIETSMKKYVHEYVLSTTTQSQSWIYRS